MNSTVKPGYKMTEVGVIPEDWKAVPLAAITTQIGDGLHGTPVYSHNGDYFFINGNNLNIGKIVIADETQKVDRSQFLKHQKPLTNRSILMSINGTIGNLGLFDDEPIVLGKSAAYLNVKLGVSKQFVYQSLQTHTVRQQFFDGLTGSTIGNLGLTTIRRAQIALPPTEDEQRAIAQALSDVDALLDTLEKMITKKRGLKQAAMQQLLTGKTRLPGFRGGLQRKTLGELGLTYGGLTGKTKSNFGVGTGKYITFMNVMKNAVIDCAAFEQVEVLPTETQNRVLRGDLVFNGSSETPEEIAFCALVAQEVPDLYLNSFCFGFRLFNDWQVDGLFLTYYIRANPGREMMKSLAQGSTRYNLSKTALREASVLLPLKDEQAAIAEVLSGMDAELIALETRRDKTRNIKQAMMQELLTGKTRLVEGGVNG